jgi:hypothetical protein
MKQENLIGFENYLNTPRVAPNKVKGWGGTGNPPGMSRSEMYAYCAGLFDGDGCIYISKTHTPGRKNPTYRLCMSLDQNCRVTVECFQKVLNVQCHLTQIPRTVQHNRQAYSLRFDGVHAAQALRLLRPYLVRKGIEADVGLEFLESGQTSLHPGPKGTPAEVWRLREALYKKLKALK